jgi:hypothetical protein
MIKFCKTLKGHVGAIALSFLLVFSLTNNALAVTASSPVVVNNGNIALQNETATNWATYIGTPTGSGEFVRATNPSLAGVTVTGTADLTGATVNLPSGAVDAIAELASGIRKGTANSTKIVTSTSGSVTNNNCAKWDSDGNLVDSGGACGSTFVAHHDISPQTPLTVLSATKVFCGLNGECSTTSNGTDVQTPLYGTGTFTSVNCQATTGTTNAVTAKIFTGTCNGALSTGTAQNVMSATAWTAGTASGTTSFTDGQCAVVEFSAGTNAAKAGFRCSAKQTAGS